MMFFFFKQKTAYEMRISDWSSDVCSSDLIRDRDQVPGKAAKPAHEGTDEERSGHVDADEADGDDEDRRRHQHLQDVGELLALEIGRASCRERVCPYV